MIVKYKIFFRELLIAFSDHIKIHFVLAGCKTSSMGFRGNMAVTGNTLYSLSSSYSPRRKIALIIFDANICQKIWLRELFDIYGRKSEFLVNKLSAAQIAEQRSHDIMWRWEQQQKSSFFKQSKKSFPMFQYIEEKTRVYKYFFSEHAYFERYLSIF